MKQTKADQIADQMIEAKELMQSSQTASERRYYKRVHESLSKRLERQEGPNVSDVRAAVARVLDPDAAIMNEIRERYNFQQLSNNEIEDLHLQHFADLFPWHVR